MSDPENKMTDSSELAELREQCVDLSRQNSLLLVGLLMASVTLTAYLFVQSLRSGQQVDQMKQTINAAQQQEAFIAKLAGHLAEYGHTHPDFMPIIVKYGIPTNPPAAGARPQPPAAPKK